MLWYELETGTEATAEPASGEHTTQLQYIQAHTTTNKVKHEIARDK